MTTALCAILHQLFSHQRQLIRHVIPAWDKNGIKLTGETLELWRIWLVAARDPEVSNVACVLDALDECKEAERSKMISLLTDFYGRILSSTPSNRHGRSKILVTSRPYDDVHRGFNAIPSNLPTIQLPFQRSGGRVSAVSPSMTFCAIFGKRPVDTMI